MCFLLFIYDVLIINTLLIQNWLKENYGLLIFWHYPVLQRVTVLFCYLIYYHYTYPVVIEKVHYHNLKPFGHNSGLGDHFAIYFIISINSKRKRNYTQFFSKFELVNWATLWLFYIITVMSLHIYYLQCNTLSRGFLIYFIKQI